MSKKKLLIHEVFRKAQNDFPNKGTKSGWSNELSDYFEKTWNFIIHERTLTRYYNSCIRDNNEPDIIDKEILDKLSQYVEFKNFAHFSTSFSRKDEDTRSTTVRIDVGDYNVSQSEKEKGIKIIITQHFNIPEFVKKNGVGIVGIILIASAFAGNKYFPSVEKSDLSNNPLSVFSGTSLDIDKKYMYWNGERYIATNDNYIGPIYRIIAMDKELFSHFKKITRPDTLTLVNSLGKVWCSKYNNEVSFFTMDGVDPDNNKELKLATDHMILTYGKGE
ncbi:hypothetical protein WH221_13100 [Chryseobacterium culicis]|uniref:Uncharacterized protein n=1 Tax=Chryseobacterium culicis TaxID=680127 RepID=A0A2S9CRB4_CHRCI|nr:hypothetical protein [Chryseobacterium culicis]PRB83064.1 hypothetical protein CQ022_13080 [Chryseobacterium culicis]PRB89305.1 hypothetical protein CQ033_11980 [Chryseobacterium culicis]